MKVGSRSWLLGMALPVLAACGGSTSGSGGTGAGAAGVSSSGGASGGAGVVGGGAGDHAVVGASAGRKGDGAQAGLGGTSASGSGSGGSSGVSPDGGKAGSSGSGAGSGGSGGSAGEPDIEDCKVPYAGPVAGPRVGGPMPTGNCASIPDELILARYMDYEGRVPEGLYYESSLHVANERWDTTPCSSSAADTAQRLSLLMLGTAEAQFETPWFYEATSCNDGFRVRYRNLRCDYFDGTVLADKSLKNLPFLGSLLWWTQRNYLFGSALLGYTVTSGDATDFLELCSIDTGFGDFGLCDHIDLMSTTIRLGQVDGVVHVDDPKLIKSVQGACH